MKASDHPRCNQCKYHTALGHWTKDPEIVCYYIAHTYKRRGCPIDKCDKFEPGKPKKYRRRYEQRDHSQDEIRKDQD